MSRNHTSKRKVSPKRFVFPIATTRPVKAKLLAASDRFWMTGPLLMSVLVDWFAEQNEVIQELVLGHCPPEIQKRMAKRILSNKRGLRKSLVSKHTASRIKGRHSPQIIARIELSAPTLEKLGQVRERLGMTQVALISRMIEWLGSQTAQVQAAVIR